MLLVLIKIPSFQIAPPFVSSFASLLVKLLSVMVKVPSFNIAPPPYSFAVFPVNIELIIFKNPSPSFQIASPLLLVKLQSAMVAGV